MFQVQIRLRPARAYRHTEVAIRMTLPRPLCRWELMELCETLRVRSASPVRVIVPAEAPADWLDAWCDVLAEAVAARIEVHFAPESRRGARQRRTRGAQLEVRFGEPRDMLRRQGP